MRGLDQQAGSYSGAADCGRRQMKQQRLIEDKYRAQPVRRRIYTLPLLATDKNLGDTWAG